LGVLHRAAGASLDVSALRGAVRARTRPVLEPCPSSTPHELYAGVALRLYLWAEG
jgi:hypothetical protein